MKPSHLSIAMSALLAASIVNATPLRLDKGPDVDILPSIGDTENSSLQALKPMDSSGGMEKSFSLDRRQTIGSMGEDVIGAFIRGFVTSSLGLAGKLATGQVCPTDDGCLWGWNS